VELGSKVKDILFLNNQFFFSLKKGSL